MAWMGCLLIFGMSCPGYKSSVNQGQTVDKTLTERRTDTDTNIKTLVAILELIWYGTPFESLWIESEVNQ